MINELGATRTDAPLPDVNELEAAPNRRLMFERRHQPGRVDLVRTGNLVQATTSGVRRFTLLLSPDQFDFSQPVRVMVNGRAGLRRARRAIHENAAEMGRPRQRPDDVVWGGDFDSTVAIDSQIIESARQSPLATTNVCFTSDVPTTPTFFKTQGPGFLWRHAFANVARYGRPP